MLLPPYVGLLNSMILPYHKCEVYFNEINHNYHLNLSKKLDNKVFNYAIILNV